MTGYYITGYADDWKHAVLSTWAPTQTMAENYAATISHQKGVTDVVITADSDLSDLGEVYHETSTVEAQMDDFETRAAAFDKEVESAWSTLRRHKLARLNFGDAEVFAVAEVIRKLEVDIDWLRHDDDRLDS